MPATAEPWYLTAQVIVAIVAALTSLLVSVISFLTTRSNHRDVERLKADLADRSAQRNARIEYEFEARKRLYQECGPLLFELSELAERALGRIAGLARTAADGNLGSGAESWMGRGYYRRSTYYRLLAPLAMGKLLRGKLTHLDLSLDPSIHWQYALCKQLADTFTDDFDFAEFSPSLSYKPHAAGASQLRIDRPETYWQQGIPRGILDNAVTALISNDADGRRVLSFAEFEARFDGQQDGLARSFQRIDYLLESFHPQTRPVLWRSLLAQAHLYRALLFARERPPDPELWKNVWGAERPDFDWRSTEQRERIEAAEIARAVEIGAQYAETKTFALLQRIRTR
ncbi:MAG: hypothetical protein L0387_17110 [Acidobacteria bacterium]|nr:hypothetical protein [Acidobacteriota bacterium]MCI0724090.1 hypothetical protein [Acidobacteriota bacterium]